VLERAVAIAAIREEALLNAVGAERRGEFLRDEVRP
jgi:hypothetical protein